MSHRTSGKCLAIQELLDAKKSDAIPRIVALFHTFGSTVTLWYPLIERCALLLIRIHGRGQMRGADRPMTS